MLSTWGHTALALVGTTLSYLLPTAGKAQAFPFFTITILRTSQIQLKHEVKNSCDVVRRGVQSPGTQATAGTQVQHVVLGSAMVTAQQAAAASH